MRSGERFRRARARTRLGTRPAKRACASPRPDQAQTEYHHHVYVVLLDPAAARNPKVRAANPGPLSGRPCVYVGMSGLTPEQRFANHKAGIKASSIVRRFGLRLLPELYVHLNPMPYEAAVQMEKDLAEDLRALGYVVAGGH